MCIRVFIHPPSLPLLPKELLKRVLADPVAQEEFYSRDGENVPHQSQEWMHWSGEYYHYEGIYCLEV